MIVRRERSRQSWPRRVVRRKSPVVGQRRPRPVSPPLRGSLRRWWAFATAVVLCAGAAAWSAWSVWHSPLVEIREVRVTGTERLAAEVVVERSGLFGQNIFTADLAAAQEAVLTLPLVSSVRIERAWPRGVRIEVVERAPWGTWEQAGFRYTIDREGVVLGTMPPPPGSLVIRSSAPGTLRVGDRVDPDAVRAAAVLADLLPSRLGVGVAEVAFEAGKGVVVTTTAGKRAYFGDSGGLDYKVAVWAAVAQEAAERGIDYAVIDLRFGNRPVVQ